jgi:hypothetical protein
MKTGRCLATGGEALQPARRENTYLEKEEKPWLIQ